MGGSMKWFQHETDAHKHPDLELIMDEFGSDGYLGYFGTLEIIGRFCDKYMRLPLEKVPKNQISKRLRLKEDTLDKIWQFMAKRNALSSNLLKKGVLHAPGLRKRADEYTKKLRTKSGQTTDNIRLQYNTLQDITRQYITLKGWGEAVKSNKRLEVDIYKRNCKPIKQLYIALNGDKDKVIECIKKGSAFFESKGLAWTIETVIKHLPDLLTNKIKKEPSAKEVIEIDKYISDQLGGIATKEKIIETMKNIPQKYWLRVKTFLGRRYPEDGQQSYYRAEEGLTR